MVYHSIHGNCPEHLTELFVPAHNIHNYQTRHVRNGLFPTHMNLVAGQRSFLNRHCHLWNSLPQTIQCASTTQYDPNPSWKASTGGEHVVAAFLDVEKAFDNVWHNGLRFKIFQLDLPTKMTHWLSDFLVGRLIQVNVNNFFSSQINPMAGVPQGSVLSPLLS